MSDRAPLDVVGIGSMVVDRIHRAPRILGPDEKGILRTVEGALTVQTRIGGVVLNQLGWATCLGLRAGIFGKQADDGDGRRLRAAMDRHGIQRQIALDGSASSRAQIFVDDTGGRAIYMAPGATSETTANDVRERHADFIRRGARLITEVSQLPLDAALAALELARAAGIPTLVDLDVPPSDAVPGLGDARALRAVLTAADLIKPSKAAAREFFPKLGGDALELARATRAKFGAGAVVVTDGAAGCAISAADFEARIAAPDAKTLDTTGAGDAFVGGLLAALHHDLGWDAAARLANACGAACVEQLGAFPEDPRAARARVLELYEGPELPLGPLCFPVAAGDPDPHAEIFTTFDVALEELHALRGRLDLTRFAAATRLIRDAERAHGRVHVTGVGKAALVAQYAAGVLSSTGTPAAFVHATEVVHGGAGQVVAGDVVIVVSNSGETPEVLAAAAALRQAGALLIGVTGGLESSLARAADVVLDAGANREGGGLGFAPRASVAAEVLVLAALSAALERERGFTRSEYHARHPAGSLGRRSAPRDDEAS
ncbi:MAG: SIS domain-containing protein [Deltaproteobacteria bacterium]|nr:MAG: SIS domain-containing protein [Deltaproteobacteria bacterium]